jgi:hypothetical protein
VAGKPALPLGPSTPSRRLASTPASPASGGSHHHAQAYGTSPRLASFTPPRLGLAELRQPALMEPLPLPAMPMDVAALPGSGDDATASPATDAASAYPSLVSSLGAHNRAAAQAAAPAPALAMSRPSVTVDAGEFGAHLVMGRGAAGSRKYVLIG